jgi:hypothetical protein
VESAPVDYGQIIQAALMIAMAVAGWFMRMLWTATQDLKADLSTLRAGLPEKYVLKDDYKIELGRIHELLEKIYDKLEKKVDK